ncbi:hypothetical protein RchiOBHm_Chr7g0232201 [Rosa chinensis]|uniref:DOG1 domain-containing protein n=1 Tax=Rosa chinensis TaxID=74649 RepID=A0A2P6PFV3_ROSCH|nr:hypothetical protein RchiOBHm_Chr7g0232201 [Rosa chinensis]
MILCMAETSAGDLNSDQARQLDRLKLETWRRERELSETIAKIQESVAAPPILETGRKVGRLMDGEISTLEVLKVAMLRLTESADGLRG